MSSTSSSVLTGVAGLITTPARQSWLLIRQRVRFKWRQASWCTEIQSAPASANAGMNSSGFSIIRWQSRGNSVTRRSDFTTGGPMVRLGTKCPSIISTWMTLAPPSLAARTCSPRRAKSAERIEGANSINVGLLKLKPGLVLESLLQVYHSNNPADINCRKPHGGLDPSATVRAECRVQGIFSPTFLRHALLVPTFGPLSKATLHSHWAIGYSSKII